MEKQCNNKLSFLDVLLDNTNKLCCSIYHKPTYTGLLTNYFSFIPNTYKVGLIRTLVDRTFKITNSWKLFHTDLQNLRKNLCKNMLPPKLIDGVMNSYLE